MAKRKAPKRDTPKYTERENRFRTRISNQQVSITRQQATITRYQREVAVLKNGVQQRLAATLAADHCTRVAEAKLAAYSDTMVMRGPVRPTAIDGKDLDLLLCIPTPDITTLAAILDELVAWDNIKKCGICRAVLESHTHPMSLEAVIPRPRLNITGEATRTETIFTDVPPDRPDDPPRREPIGTVRMICHPTLRVDDHPDTPECRQRCEMCNPLGSESATTCPGCGHAAAIHDGFGCNYDMPGQCRCGVRFGGRPRDRAPDFKVVPIEDAVYPPPFAGPTKRY